MPDAAEADQTPLGQVMQSAWRLSQATAEPDDASEPGLISGY